MTSKRKLLAVYSFEFKSCFDWAKSEARNLDEQKDEM